MVSIEDVNKAISDRLASVDGDVQRICDTKLADFEAKLNAVDKKADGAAAYAVIEARVGRYADYANRREYDFYEKNIIIANVDKLNRKATQDEIKKANDDIVEKFIQSIQVDVETTGVYVKSFHVKKVTRLFGRPWDGDPNNAPKYANKDRIRITLINKNHRDNWIECAKHNKINDIYPETPLNDRKFTDYIYSEKRRLNSNPEGTHWWFVSEGRLIRGAKRQEGEKYDPKRDGNAPRNRRDKGGGGGSLGFGFSNNIGYTFDTGTRNIIGKGSGNSNGGGSSSGSSGSSSTNTKQATTNVNIDDIWDIVNSVINPTTTPAPNMENTPTPSVQSPKSKVRGRSNSVQQISTQSYNSNSNYYTSTPNSKGTRGVSARGGKRTRNSSIGDRRSDRIANLHKNAEKARAQFQANMERYKKGANNDDQTTIDNINNVSALIERKKATPRTISQRSPNDGEKSKAQKTNVDTIASVVAPYIDPELISMDEINNSIRMVDAAVNVTIVTSESEEDDVDEEKENDNDKNADDDKSSDSGSETSDDNSPGSDSNSATNNSNPGDDVDDDDIDAAADTDHVPQEKPTSSTCITNAKKLVLKKSLVGHNSISPEDLFLQISEKFAEIYKPQCNNRKKLFEQFISDVYGIHFLGGYCEDEKTQKKFKEWCQDSLDFCKQILKLPNFAVSNQFKFDLIEEKATRIFQKLDIPSSFSTISCGTSYILQRQEILKSAKSEEERKNLRKLMNCSIDPNASLSESALLDIFED